jgi:hypothetical protein
MVNSQTPGGTSQSAVLRDNGISIEPSRLVFKNRSSPPKRVQVTAWGPIRYVIAKFGYGSDECVTAQDLGKGAFEIYISNTFDRPRCWVKFINHRHQVVYLHIRLRHWR